MVFCCALGVLLCAWCFGDGLGRCCVDVIPVVVIFGGLGCSLFWALGWYVGGFAGWLVMVYLFVVWLGYWTLLVWFLCSLVVMLYVLLVYLLWCYTHVSCGWVC